MGRVHVGDVGVVRQPASQQGDASRAADGRGAVVALVQSALVDEVLLDQGHVVQRVHVQVLVVGEHEHNVRLLALGIRAPFAAQTQRPLLIAASQDGRELQARRDGDS